MRQNYKKKIKTEKALIKAFGLEQRSLSYNDAISGYVNSAFDSNSLLPIPGTNLYSYEGSNPIWLRKYDKIENKKVPTISSSSPSSNDKKINKSTEDCSFYLKQAETTPATSRCSSSSGSNHLGDKTRLENITLTSEVLSLKDDSPNQSDFKKSTKGNTMFSMDLLTFSKPDSRNQLTNNQENSILYLANDSVDDDYQKKFIYLNQPKDCCDLFAVESTVI